MLFAILRKNPPYVNLSTLTFPLPKPQIRLNQENFQILNCPTKSTEGVTTQMKALDEDFLMVVLTLLLNGVHVFFNLYV